MVTWTVNRKEGFVITAPPGSLGITIKKYDNEYIVTDVSSHLPLVKKYLVLEQKKRMFELVIQSYQLMVYRSNQ